VVGCRRGPSGKWKDDDYDVLARWRSGRPHHHEGSREAWQTHPGCGRWPTGSNEDSTPTARASLFLACSGASRASLRCRRQGNISVSSSWPYESLENRCCQYKPGRTRGRTYKRRLGFPPRLRNRYRPHRVGAHSEPVMIARYFHHQPRWGGIGHIAHAVEDEDQIDNWMVGQGQEPSGRHIVVRRAWDRY
jgi:hypothetical protein